MNVTATDVTEYALGGTAWLASLAVLAIGLLHLAAPVPQAPLAVLSAGYLFLVGVVALPAGRRGITTLTGQHVYSWQWVVLGAFFLACSIVSFALFLLG